MKKYKLIDACYDKQSGESYACIQTDLGTFEGFAKLHPAEKYPSTYVGCEYAEYRAVIKALKAEKRVAKAQLKTMKDYYHLISHMKGFDFKSDAASKARRTIYVLERQVKELDRRVEVLNNKLSTSMGSREGFLKKLFKRKNEG